MGGVKGTGGPLSVGDDPGRLRAAWDAVRSRLRPRRLGPGEPAAGAAGALRAPRGAAPRGWTVEHHAWSTTPGATVIAPAPGVLARRKVTVFAHRAPTSLLWSDGSSLLRVEESREDASLLKLPPRITRSEASLATPSGPYGRRTGGASRGWSERSQPPSILPTSSLSWAKWRRWASETQRGGVGEPHEHAGADQAARGGGEVGALVAKGRGLDEVLGDVEAGMAEAIADGEAVIAGELGDPLGHPGEQRFHADGDHRRCSRAGGGGPGPPAPCVAAAIARHRR
ncbi:hypothetical protein [Sorangium sp. So ce1000]|uniref:hypothetical protein n=1 Tax=Sorangium sp. So ce1000 TaxID=3133325 RepID=UPI003F6303AF